MSESRFERLVRRNLITSGELEEAARASRERGCYIEDHLLACGIPKHELIFCASEHYNCACEEYDEGLTISQGLLRRLDFGQLKSEMWFPVAVYKGRAEVIAYDPKDPSLAEKIKKALVVSEIDFRAALPADLIRIIENNYDLNNGFQPTGGRTPLALSRVYLAYRRSTYAHYRTLLARGRTGLAFIRAGISALTIALLFWRIFGTGLYAILEVPLTLFGIIAIFDGLKWYMPSRPVGGMPVDCSSTEPDGGSSVLGVAVENNSPVFRRSAIVRGAERLRAAWSSLSPVMRRRFIASDRSDMAEERTGLAGHRTELAKARTGLAFTRTGATFIGLGIALIRHFHSSGWTVFDITLITLGTLMCAEGLYWYLAGQRSAMKAFKWAQSMNYKESIWDFVLPFRKRPHQGTGYPPVEASHEPGIWATTGLALERTVLAERRCVMARFRTIMGLARTGQAIIRTGISIIMVGAGLMMFFGTGSAGWTIFNIILVVGGLYLVFDGFRWMNEPEQIRRQYPYCYGDMEIVLPDYGKPARYWKKVIFNHEPD